MHLNNLILKYFANVTQLSKFRNNLGPTELGKHSKFPNKDRNRKLSVSRPCIKVANNTANVPKKPSGQFKKNDNNIYSFKQRVLKITNFVRFNWTELFWYIVIHEWIYDLMTFGNIQSVGGYFGSYWFFHFRSSSFLPRTWNCKWRTKGALHLLINYWNFTFLQASDQTVNTFLNRDKNVLNISIFFPGPKCQIHDKNESCFRDWLMLCQRSFGLTLQNPASKVK